MSKIDLIYALTLILEAVVTFLKSIKNKENEK